MNFSVTQGTNLVSIVAVIVLIAKQFKVDVDTEQLTAIISGGVVLVSQIISFINRFSKGDVTIAGAYKE